MNPAFAKYLETLGMGVGFIKRIECFHDECRVLATEDFRQIFVSEQLVRDRGAYLNLHFFTSYHVFTFKNFADVFRVEMKQLERISTCEIQAKDLILKTCAVSKTSLLYVVAKWEPTSFYMEFHASDNNCLHLLDILKDFLIPKVSNA